MQYSPIQTVLTPHFSGFYHGFYHETNRGVSQVLLALEHARADNKARDLAARVIAIHWLARSKGVGGEEAEQLQRDRTHVDRVKRLLDAFEA